MMTDPAPTAVRACGSELAEGRLVAVHRVYPWGEVGRLSGDQVCPVHDRDWPHPDGRPTGQCLVTYRAEGVAL
jgi:hypothetical protein